jgi:hypothetical protein
MPDARVGHHRLGGGKRLRRVGRQHREPDGIDLNLQISIGPQHRILNPLGAAQASRSCRRDQDDEPWDAAIPVELRFQFREDVSVPRAARPQRAAAGRQHREEKE